MNEIQGIRSVFISSTAVDLLEYREAASAVIQLIGHRCIKMEYFPAAPDSPESYCQKRIEECDIFVGLLGHCYGSSPPDREISFTEMEFDIARRLGKECLMFLMSDDFPMPPKYMIQDGRSEKQIVFRKKINQKLVRGVFGTPDELKLKLMQAIESLPRAPHPKADCVVLCGGPASRLWPLTIGFCKVLLPIAGRPVLDYVLRFVFESNSIERTFLLTNQEYEQEIKGFINKSGRNNAEVVVEPKSASGARLGPIGALDYIVSQKKPRHLVVLGGDNLFNFKLSEFIHFAHQKGTSANAFYRFETGCDVSQYGVAMLAPDGSVTEFNEKQVIPAYMNISTACYFFREGEVGRINEYLRNGNDPYSLGSFVHWLVSQKIPISGRIFTCPWFDIGTRHRLLDANRHFLVDVRHGSMEGHNDVKGPVKIERGACVRDSLIGPNVYLGANVRVENSVVRDSIIMDGAFVRHSNVISSIVGPQSTIEGPVVEAIVGSNSNYLAEVMQTGVTDALSRI
jgi:glucose-1-phosphate thymidylyltransferase